MIHYCGKFVDFGYASETTAETGESSTIATKMASCNKQESKNPANYNSPLEKNYKVINLESNSGGDSLDDVVTNVDEDQ